MIMLDKMIARTFPKCSRVPKPGRTIIGDAQSGERRYSVGVEKPLAYSKAHRQHRVFVLLACATCSCYRAYSFRHVYRSSFCLSLHEHPCACRSEIRPGRSLL